MLKMSQLLIGERLVSAGHVKTFGLTKYGFNTDQFVRNWPEIGAVLESTPLIWPRPLFHGYLPSLLSSAHIWNDNAICLLLLTHCVVTAFTFARESAGNNID